jgi:hypothetical protein
MPAAYSAAEINAALQQRNTRLASGWLDLLGASSELIASVQFNSTAGAVVGTTLTFSGFPKTATPGITGTAIASARLRNAALADVATGFTVGLAGSGAQVIVNKMTPASGDTVAVQSCTLTDS